MATTNSKKLLNKYNIALVTIMYVLFSFLTVPSIWSESNLAAPFLFDKIILTAACLLIASPMVSIASLIMKLQIENGIKTKDIYEYLIPTKGSLGNPDIGLLLGEKWNKFLKVLLWILVCILFITMFGGIIYQIASLTMNN